MATRQPRSKVKHPVLARRQRCRPAIPLRPRLFASIVRAAVSSSGRVPVTTKLRLGIDDALITFLSAGRIAEAEGSSAVGLHARTAAQLYDGAARWEAIGELKAALRVPVLGNGDVWEAADALRMLRATRCDGVIVGRGCLGRPWLFRDLADVFDGRLPADPPALGEVVRVMLGHARRLSDWMGEPHAMRNFRKHASWYTKGFRGSAELRARLMQVRTFSELEALLAALDPAEPFPATAMRVPRGKHSGTQKVSLPEGWLENPEDATPPGIEAEDVSSGG